MPGKDGTGPLGKGPIAGRNSNSRGRNNMHSGPVGYCVCSKCGEKTVHTAGMPCVSVKCPKCGSLMIRGI